MKRRASSGRSIWPLIALAMVAGPPLLSAAPWLATYPNALVLPITALLTDFMAWFVALFGPIFHAAAWRLGWLITWVTVVLHWLPWPLPLCLAAIVEHIAGGRKLGLSTPPGYMALGRVGTE